MERATVVVVHGLWMTGAVFTLQRWWLERFGYRVVTFSYASVRLRLDDIAQKLMRFVCGLRGSRLHFVGHSLGGLVVLDMLASEIRLPVGRLVLLGSPVAGSIAANQLARSRAGRLLIGKALPDWRSERGAEVAARIDIGMIAGSSRLGLGRFVARLPVPNDGAVCVDETRMAGLRDHIVLPVSHSGMMVSARVARQIHTFLELGHFAH